MLYSMMGDLYILVQLEIAYYFVCDFPAALMITLVSSSLFLIQIVLFIILYCLNAHIDTLKKELIMKLQEILCYVIPLGSSLASLNRENLD